MGGLAARVLALLLFVASSVADPTLRTRPNFATRLAAGEVGVAPPSQIAGALLCRAAPHTAPPNESIGVVAAASRAV